MARTIPDFFSFKVDWYNPESEVTKDFLLTFFTSDASIQLFDLKMRRLFLRRMKLPNMQLQMFYKHSKINILSRLMKVVDYGDSRTQNYFEGLFSNIFFIIKPNGMKFIGKIISILEKEGFSFTDMKIGIMGEEKAQVFFSQNNDPSKNRSITNAVSETPCLAISAFGKTCEIEWMEEHETNQNDVLNEDQDTQTNDVQFIRQYAFIRSRKEDYQKAMDLWFPKDRYHDVCPYIMSTNSTCCVIKPHIVRERNIGNLMQYILSNGFGITGLHMMTLAREHVYEFLKLYMGVILDQASIDDFTSGPCIAMEIINLTNPSETVESFRNLTGFINPTLGCKTQPNTIRAKFGTSLAFNAVHSTDLPDNAERELNYLFKIWPQYIT